MKEKELREHTICMLCRLPIGHTGLPLFWVVKIERFGIDMSAVRRQDGLTAMLNGRADLAQVMGADEDMAKSIMGPITITLCEQCAIDDFNVTIARLSEIGIPPEVE